MIPMKVTDTDLSPHVYNITTEHGTFSYTLHRKHIKNLNLHIDGTGMVTLSIPNTVSDQQAEYFLHEKSKWIMDQLEKQARCQVTPLPEYSLDECTRRLKNALIRIYPLVHRLGVVFPELKLRHMKSQWGNCHWTRGYITLNTALARCPEHLQEYVVLHELVHFLHHDHGPGFHACMESLMPDWRYRRHELKSYGAALG